MKDLGRGKRQTSPGFPHFRQLKNPPFLWPGQLETNKTNFRRALSTMGGEKFFRHLSSSSSNIAVESRMLSRSINVLCGREICTPILGFSQESN